jgi:hypothetical protein
MSKTKNPETLKQRIDRQRGMIINRDSEIQVLKRKLEFVESANLDHVKNTAKLVSENEELKSEVRMCRNNATSYRHECEVLTQAFDEERRFLQEKNSRLFIAVERERARANKSEQNGCALTSTAPRTFKP